MNEEKQGKNATREFEAAGKVGATVEHGKGVRSGYESASVLRYPNQATFHR